MTAARAAVACLLAAAAAPAEAFVRSTTCSGDPNAGYAFWWAGAPPVVNWRLSSAHVPVGCAPAGCTTASCGGDFQTLESLVQSSVDAWAQARTSPVAAVCTGLTTAYGGQTADQAVGVMDGQQLLVFRKGTCAEVVPAGTACLTRGGCGNLYNCWEDAASTLTLALTIVTFRIANGQILDADTEFWDWNGSTTSATGHYFTCAPPGSPACSGAGLNAGLNQEGCVEWDVGSVATHEAGHIIGLDHQTSVASVMAPTLGAGFTGQRVLQPDDVSAVCSIYPPGAPAVQQQLPGTCTTASQSSGSSGGGCGCGGGGGGLPLLLLLPFLPRRRPAGVRVPAGRAAEVEDRGWRGASGS